MIELGKIQCLNVVKKTDFGVYLGKEDEKVLLPGKMVPEDIEIGDALTVFVYRDSDDRLIATTKKPFITLGQLAKLKVSQISKIGAFLDWGLDIKLTNRRVRHYFGSNDYPLCEFLSRRCQTWNSFPAISPAPVPHAAR